MSAQSLFPEPVSNGPHVSAPALAPRPTPEAEAYGLASPADPATSDQAAIEHARSGRLTGNRALCLELVREYPGYTACELHHAQGDRGTMDRHEVSRRLADLKNMGLVRHGPARECEVAKTKQVTWDPVEESR